MARKRERAARPPRSPRGGRPGRLHGATPDERPGAAASGLAGSDDSLHRPFADLQARLRAAAPPAGTPGRAAPVPRRTAAVGTPGDRGGSAGRTASPAAERRGPAPATGRLGDLVRAARDVTSDARAGATASDAELWRRSGAGAHPMREPDEDPVALFTRAVAGVRRLDPDVPPRVERPPAELRARPEPSEEEEALATLADLVTGNGLFDVTDTHEYFEGRVAGLDPRILGRLRRGEFSWQVHLDLHGLTLPEAKEAVDGFLAEARRVGRRCVLLVHGRGLNSPEGVPVLKEAVKRWLSGGRSSRWILAFATARPRDGGAGAVYVLLRRDRGAERVRLSDGSSED